MLRSQVNQGGEKEIIKVNKHNCGNIHRPKLKNKKRSEKGLPTHHVEVDRRIWMGSIVELGKCPHNHRL